MNNKMKAVALSASHPASGTSMPANRTPFSHSIKIILLLSFFIAGWSRSFAQNTWDYFWAGNHRSDYPSSWGGGILDLVPYGEWEKRGNVGIGTHEPKAKLHIKGYDGPANFPNIHNPTLFIEPSPWGPGAKCSIVFGNDRHYIREDFKDGMEITDTTGIEFASDGRFSFTSYSLMPATFDTTMAIVRPNVGIGTSNPQQKLTIAGYKGDNYIQVQGRGAYSGYSGIALTEDNNYGYIMRNSGSTDKLTIDRTNDMVNFFNSMTFDRSGNVGIGTTSPDEPLTIQGAGSVNELVSFKDNTGATKWNINLAGGLNIAETNVACRLTINPGGNVGIGTMNPGNYKLAVEGTIGAREIQVKTGSWSDFVFADDYKLKSLDEIEKYINAHKHLPDVPAEATVKKDGINVAQMDALLLQKIEELTLHLIEQDKRVKAIERENEQLKEKLDQR